jgi:hypothetical protein
MSFLSVEQPDMEERLIELMHMHEEGNAHAEMKKVANAFEEFPFLAHGIDWRRIVCEAISTDNREWMSHFAAHAARCVDVTDVLPAGASYLDICALFARGILRLRDENATELRLSCVVQTPFFASAEFIIRLSKEGAGIVAVNNGGGLPLVEAYIPAEIYTKCKEHLERGALHCHWWDSPTHMLFTLVPQYVIPLDR